MALSIFHIDLGAMVERVQNSLSQEIAEYEEKYNFNSQSLNQNGRRTVLPTQINPQPEQPVVNENQPEQNSTQSDKQAINNLSSAISVDVTDDSVAIVADASTNNVEDAIADEIVNVITKSTEVDTEIKAKVEEVKEESNATLDEIKEEISEEISKYLEYYKNLISKHKSNVQYQKALSELSSRFRHSFQNLDIAGQDLFTNNDAMRRNASSREQSDLEGRREIEELDKELQRKMSEKMSRRI